MVLHICCSACDLWFTVWVALLQDANDVTKGAFTMSTTRMGKVVRKYKPYTKSNM